MYIQQPYLYPSNHSKQSSNMLSKVNSIKLMSSSKKMSTKNSIISSKIIQKLSYLEDDQIINIESSIPLLFSIHFLKIMDNIQSAKQKIEYEEYQNVQLKQEARFIYCLWKMIDEEQIETRQLKQLMYLLYRKSLKQLKHELLETYNNNDSVQQFIEAWQNLNEKGFGSSNNIETDKKIMNIDDHRTTVSNIKTLGPELNSSSCQQNSRQLRQLVINNSSIKKSNAKSSYLTDNKKQKQNNYFTTESAQLSLNKSSQKNILFFDRNKQKEVVDRLYKYDKYNNRQAQKKIDQQRKLKQELQQCTFKPSMVSNQRLRSMSNQKRSSSINGYNKTIKRMKVGQQKNRIQKQKRQYTPVGENYEKLREQKMNPPKFLQRKKNEQKVDFVLEFDLGRHKIKVKVHQNDKQSDIASNLCKIYCLKSQYFEQICNIVRKQRELQRKARQKRRY